MPCARSTPKSCRRARPPVRQRLDFLLAFGRTLDRLRRRRPRVNRSDLDAGAAFALDPQRGGIEAERKVARQHHVLAGRQVDLHDTRHGSTVRIDDNGVNG
jgi:hypothetical protein